MLEWHDYSGCHDDWFVDDGFHLRTPGQHAYAAFVHVGLLGQGADDLHEVAPCAQCAVRPTGAAASR